jgi:hypothetical protein
MYVYALGLLISLKPLSAKEQGATKSTTTQVLVQ